jgi:hypothetical protein
LALFPSGFEFLSLGEVKETGRANKHESPAGHRARGNTAAGKQVSWTETFIFLVEEKRAFPEII